MGRSHGTGYPVVFACTMARRNRRVLPGDGQWSLPPGHDVVRTGRTRKAPSPGKGSSRKLPLSHEYRCACGHVGWTCHVGILKKPVAA